MKKYVIIWDYIDTNGNAHLNQKMEFINKDEANTVWVEMRKNSVYLNLRHKTITDDELYNFVVIKFAGSDKKYTYLTRTKIKNGEEVIVNTGRGREIVKVVSSGQQTKDEFDLPFNRYVYIYAKVVKE